jgi:hypothetical protein
MAAVPRVFISSTYYDLRHVRTAIKHFVETLGFEAVLSEQFDVFYQNGKSVQRSCLDEVKRCDIYILIIGERYGSIFPNDTLSITHREYKEAIEANLPIFTFVDTYTYDDYKIYCRNKANPDVNVSKIQYSNVRDFSVFGFISEVDNKTTDNILICFNQIAEIIDCLRKQFARMFKERALQPMTKKDEEKKAAIMQPIVDKTAFQSLLNNFALVGMPSSGISESDIQKSDKLLDLLKNKADSVDDLGTDFRISIGGSIVNIGKSIMDLLSEQYRQIRGGH